MNFRQLEVFLAVAESGSFSKGAEATFLTQSTVSQHISSLEQELGIRLLDRTAKGALPTEGGKILLDRGRRIMTEMRGITPAINRFKGLEDVSLTIGASNIPGNYMIPQALPHLLRRFPRLAITVFQGNSHDILGKIKRHEVEIGIVGSKFADDGFSYVPLGQERIILVAGRDHPFYEKRNISAAELAGESMISREEGSGTGKTVKEALAAIGIDAERLAVKVHLGGNEGVKQAVIHGAGISFLSELSARRELERGELAELSVPGLEIIRQFHLASRAGRELSPAATAFARTMIDILGQTP